MRHEGRRRVPHLRDDAEQLVALKPVALAGAGRVEVLADQLPQCRRALPVHPPRAVAFSSFSSVSIPTPAALLRPLLVLRGQHDVLQRAM